ncbi:hypothetical protein LTS08_002451 [Lithohypha guttulata]|nr:hypothetical protein LTS08_002451 [Lithohypha guttulata]
MAGTTMVAPKALLHTLSAAPPSTCRAERIDFEKAGLPEYRDKFAVLIHDLFSAEECKRLLEAAEESQSNQWEEAMVNIGNGRQRLMTDIRSCGRIIWDNSEVVEQLLARLKPHLPGNVCHLENCPGITGLGPAKRNETWILERLNERLRFLRYTSGMYFRKHQDGSYVTPDGKEISFLTVHLYLNGQEDRITEGVHQSTQPLRGGATRFFGFKNNHYDVIPARGAVLVFQHRGLYHSGEEVEKGTKYTARTDVMYRKVK